MESKKKCSYQAVLSYIKTELLPNFNPSKILTDFETGPSITLQDNFPSARRMGCWFHHNQVNKNTLHFQFPIIIGCYTLLCCFLLTNA